MQVNNNENQVLEVILNHRRLKNVDHIHQIIKPRNGNGIWEIHYPHVTMMATGMVTVVIERESDLTLSDISELLETKIIPKRDNPQQ